MNWSPSHIRALVPGFIIVFLFAALTRYFSEKRRNRFMRLFLISLFVMEGVKQLLAIKNYSALYLPFHYSTSFYVCMTLYLFGRGRIKHFGACATYVGGFFLLLSIVFSPASIVGNPSPEVLRSSFYHFYSLYYHLSVLFVWATLLFNGDYISEKGDPLRYAAFLGTWASFAIPASYITGFNYAGILRSYIPPLETLRLVAGDVVYLITYSLIAFCGASLLIYIHHYILHNKVKVTDKTFAEDDKYQ